MNDLTQAKRLEAERAAILERLRVAEQRAARAEARQRLLARVSAHMAAADGVSDRAEALTSTLVPELADWCVLDLLEDGGQLRRPSVGYANPEATELASRLMRPHHVDALDPGHPIARAVRVGETQLLAEIDPIFIDAAYHDPRDRDDVLAMGPRSAVVTPLRSRGAVVGVLWLVYAESDRRYSTEDAALIEEIGRQAGVLLDNARLIAAERAASASIAASEARLQRQADLLDLGYEPIFAWEWDGPVIVWNRGATRLYGYSRDEAIGNVSHALLKTRHPLPLSDYLAILERDGEWIGELEHTTRDGRTVVVETHQQLVTDATGHRLVLEANRDITSRREAQAALRASEERFRATFEQAAVGIAEVGLDGLWLRVNDRLCQMVGYEREDLLQLTFQDITHPDDLDADLGLVDQLLNGEITSYTLDKRYVRKDASVVWVQLTVALVRDANAAPGYFISVVVDISDRKRAELQRDELLVAERAAREEAERALAARTQFLSIAAHELRTPTTGLQAAAQMLTRAQERDRLDPERLRTNLKRIERSAARLGVLVNDLLDVSRLQSGQLRLEPSTVDLNALVVQVIGSFAGRAAERDQSVRLESAQPTTLIEADPLRLEQVVGNLIDNALKYSAEGTQVRVRIGQSDGRVLLSVADRGIGLPDGAAQQIFDPFGRAPNAAARQIQGLGLGLYISRQIVEQHGGRIWADSPGEGRGTTVYVSLPPSHGSPQRELA